MGKKFKVMGTRVLPGYLKEIKPEYKSITLKEVLELLSEKKGTTKVMATKSKACAAD